MRAVGFRCPFCGAEESEASHIQDEDRNVRAIRLQCKNCGWAWTERVG